MVRTITYRRSTELSIIDDKYNFVYVDISLAQCTRGQVQTVWMWDNCIFWHGQWGVSNNRVARVGQSSSWEA